jgi:NADPH2:quinone reductase
VKAIVIAQPGGPEVLELRDVPTPAPGPSEVRVRVRATAVNRADLLQRMGFYPAPKGVPKDIPGMECAGEVDAIGEGAELFAMGDRVFGLVGGGAYAEHAVMHERTLAKMPEGMTFTDAAAVPEAFITAYDAMVSLARLSAGETVLVHAVGSGVGTAAVQIARAIGASSIGTARTEAKLERARQLGMGHGVCVKDGKFGKEVRRLTGDKGADVVLELVGGGYVTEDIACLAPSGRMVVVGLLAGATAEVDLGVLMRQRLEVHGTVLRSRPLEEKIQVTRVFARHLVPLFARGQLKPVVDRIFALAAAGDAHAYVAANEGFGKVVLDCG